MDVATRPERPNERFISRQMRQKSQLDLRIVGGEQLRAFLRDEQAANAATQLTSDWNVLQVRIVRRKPARRSRRLIECGVQAASARIQERRQCIDIRAFELRDLTVL